MKKYILTSDIDGFIEAIPSKSHSIRALTAALLTDGVSEIIEPIYCEDTIAAIEIIQSLGANVEETSKSLIVQGGLNPRTDIIYCNESGLCARLFSAIIPLTGRRIAITGSGSLLKRDLKDVVDSLTALGIRCDSNNGKLPFILRGGYSFEEGRIDCSSSSQFLSGLLAALPLLKQDTRIYVDNLVSKPYIDLTIDLLSYFGINIRHNEYKEFYLIGDNKFKFSKIKVEKDWSNAAFLLTAGAVAGRVYVKGLSINSVQGDKNILEVLDKAGASIALHEDGISVQRSELKAFEYDATNTPDLFPVLVSLACNCNGISKIYGTQRLINKESNRLKSLITEFSKLGINIFNSENYLCVEGGKISGAEVLSNNDHRIAMALAIVGLNSEKPVAIDNPDCVSKSYPTFFEDLVEIGGNVYE